MGAVFFYHLTRKPVDQTLGMLLTKVRARGWICQVVSPDPARLEALDLALWLGDKGSFLPHGCAGGPHDADQPVLLSTAARPEYPAQCLIALDGAEVTPEQVTQMERLCILFDGANPQAVQAARMQWSALTQAGCAAQYWSEDSGSWQMKAEKTS